jgi:uncharacterized protein
MTDLPEQLRNLLGTKGLMKGDEWRKQAETVRKERAEGAHEIDRVLPGTVVGDADDGFYLVRTNYPVNTPHGRLSLAQALACEPAHLACLANDENLLGFDPARAVFLDTETTGLAGGTGTVAFLVGAGYFTEDGLFRLDQCFMRDFDDEEPMLRWLADLLGDRATLVTYNGTSFDAPLLRTRFIQNRIPPRLDALGHLDLLHAARRMWKLRIRECNLTNVERHILGISRHGDIPSAEIPEIWLDYIRDRDARPLEKVFYHHRMDILSLVTLTAALSQQLAASGFEPLEHAEDQFSVIRLLFARKRYADVVAQGTKFLETGAGESLRRACHEMMMLAYKRLGAWPAMLATLECMLAEFPRDLAARHELAKLHEHRTRNLPEARRICSETVAFLETREALRGGSGDDLAAAAFRRRLERIERKLNRTALPSDHMEDGED